MISPEIKHC